MRSIISHSRRIPISPRLKRPVIGLAAAVTAMALSACAGSSSHRVDSASQSGEITVLSIRSIDQLDPPTLGPHSLQASREVVYPFEEPTPDHLSALLKGLPWSTR